MVHFYHVVSNRELFTICTTHLQDIEDVLTALLDWMEAHPEEEE